MKQEKKELKKVEERKLKERVKKKAQRRLNQKQKMFAKLLPISKSATQAAIDAGFEKSRARTTACELVAKSSVKIEIEKNLKQWMNDCGLSDDNLAAKFHELIYYNSEKVIRVVGEGMNAREIEEMRDARVAASTLANVVKFKGASLENTSQNFCGEISNEVALLAIKNLIQKLSNQELLIVKQSIEVLLEKSLKIVD